MRLPLDRPLRAGFLTKVRMMLKPLSSRPILTATTSAAALLLGVVLVLPLTKAPLPLALPKPQTTIITAAPVQKAESEALPAVPSPRAAPEAVMEKPMAPAGKADAGALADNAPTPPPVDAGIVAENQVMMQSAPLESYAIAPADKLAAPAMRVAGSVADSATAPALMPNTEAFSNAPQNPVHVTTEEPVSTFSTDIDTAAYSVVRASLNAGQLPPAEAVRVEEMVNYFPYDLPQPKGDTPFQPTISVMQTPYRP